MVMTAVFFMKNILTFFDMKCRIEYIEVFEYEKSGGDE